MSVETRLFHYAFGLGEDALDSAEWVEVSWDSTHRRITTINQLTDLPVESQAVNAARHLAITPAFVNAHTHVDLGAASPINLLPNEDMIDWLLRVNQSRQRSPEQIDADICDALNVMTSTGTGIIADVGQHPRVVHHMANHGVAGNVAMEFFHPSPWNLENNQPFWDRVMPLWAAFQEAFKIHGHQALTLGLSPHSPYNVSPSAWAAVVEELQPHFIHAHIAEFEEEMAYLNGETSRINDLHQAIIKKTFDAEAPFDAYLQNSFWPSSGLVAHGCELTEKDILNLNRRLHLHLVSCPRSNLHLHHKTIPTHILNAIDSPVLLGTDSALSCPTLDIRDEAKAFYSHHELHWDAKQVLKKMTLDGANGLTLKDDLGSLAIGKLAHFSIWDVSHVDEKESMLDVLLDTGRTPEIHQRVALGQVS